MYSFAQRTDTRVVDEPLYAHDLRVSGADHPGRDDVLAWQDSNGARVVERVILGPCEKPVVFFKQMAHHLVELDRGFMAHTANVILTRDPGEMLPSLAQNLATPTLADTGYRAQCELYDQLVALGQEPPVLEAREILLDPRGVLTQLCARLGLRFQERMLKWKPGPRPEDGCWAKHWYANVHTSTGFQTYKKKQAPFPRRLGPLLKECKPYYERLAALALKAEAAR
ncbi:MAG: sulfotransferase family protein [Planctomycetes bacterium]|nr:sulfotransferase family protein [Planctomycetota bacterium]